MIAFGILFAGLLVAIAITFRPRRRRRRRRRRPVHRTGWGALIDMRLDKDNHKPTEPAHVTHWSRQGCGRPWSDE